VTAKALPEDREPAIAASFAFYLTKLISPDEVGKKSNGFLAIPLPGELDSVCMLDIP
jgi:CheY-like chemotaxis protein